MADEKNLSRGVTAEEQQQMQQMMDRFRTLARTFDEVDAWQQQASGLSASAMGTTMRRVRGLDLEPMDQAQRIEEASKVLEQLFYACSRFGISFPLLCRVVFARLDQRIQCEGMDRRFERDLVVDAMRKKL